MKLRHFFLSLAVLFACAIPAKAACSGTSPNLVAALWTDVQLCHTAAVHGDKISVSNGSFTVTTTTTITKYVRIICPGTCTLTDNVADVADLINITESDQGHTRFEGFTIVQGSGQHLNPNGVINLVHASGGKGILITDNSYASGTTGDFIIAGVNRGVIWENSITATWLDVPGVRCSNNVAFVRHKNLSLTEVWTQPPFYGDDDTDGDRNLYIEGNDIDNAFEGIDVDANGRTVIRYNSIINSGIVNHGVDTGDISGRYIEIYENTFTWSQTAHCSGSTPASVTSFIYLRGAPALIHNNIIPNLTSMAWGNPAEITLTDEKLRRNAGSYGCWTGGYPSRQQVGWGYSTGGTEAGTTNEFQDLEPVYFWDNTGAGNYAAPAVVDYSPNECGGMAPLVADYIEEDREYYLDTEKPGYTAYTYPHPLTAGTHYYTAKAGCTAGACSNANNGLTRLTAKLTIGACRATISGGDTCIIGDGVYNEADINPPAGTAGAPTTFKAENRNLAIIRPTSGSTAFWFSGSYVVVDGIYADCGLRGAYCSPYLYNNAFAAPNNITLQHGTAEDSIGQYGSCIELGNGSGHLIWDMDVIDCGTDNQFDHGIYVYGTGTTIRGNRIRGTSGWGIHLYHGADGKDGAPATNIVIEGNDIYSNLNHSAMLIVQSTGTLIFNNILRSNGVNGVEFYGGNSSGAKILNNTFFGNGSSCVNIVSGITTTLVRNNICYGNGSDTITNNGTSTTSDHNLFTDPGWVNAALGDFHLIAGGAAEGTGLTVAEVTHDKDGVLRPDPDPSIGALESPSGSDPLDPLDEDFNAYTTGAVICNLNGGAGFTTSWTCDIASATVETAPSGMTGKALRLNATSQVNLFRMFTAHTGAYTICATMRLSIANPNDAGIGFNLLDATGAYQTSTYFNSSGNLVSDSLTLVSGFSANTNYEACLEFDTVSHPNEYRTTINGGTPSAWEACAQAPCLSIAGININSYSTNAHEFWLDDILEDIPAGGTITSVSPGGLVCTIASSCLISWASNGITGNVVVSYLINGIAYTIATVDYAATPYSWTVNAPAASDVQVRVSQGGVSGDSAEFQVLGRYVR